MKHTLHTRWLSVLLIAFVLGIPAVTYAQACNPSGPNTCSPGSSCKDITGGGSYFCAEDGSGCVPACTGGQVCTSGTCVTPRAPTAKDFNPFGGGGSNPTTPGGSNPTSPGGSNPTTPGGSNPTTNSGGLVDPLNNIKSLPDLLTAILNALIDLGSIILVLMLVFVGFQFVAAQGNEEKLKSARSALIWTLIGGLILLGAKSISLVIQSTVNQL